MVGTATVLSDGVNYATIDDVVVHPSHRRQSIGTKLMHAALDSVSTVDASVIKLNAIPGVEPFYEQLGFVRSGETPMYLVEHAKKEPSGT